MSTPGPDDPAVVPVILGAAAARNATVTGLDRQLVAQAASEWFRMDPADLQGSFVEQFLPTIRPALITAQTVAANVASQAVAQSTGQAPSVIPSGFAGHSATGETLGRALSRPLIEMYVDLGLGMDPSEVRTRTFDVMDQILTGEVHDAARQAESVQMVAHEVTYYIRHTEPGACDLCIVLAGKHYKVNAGFERHPSCFPAGVAVSGPDVRAATRRWFEGELVVVRTASGQQVPMTGNHPILTDRGWIAANLLQEGDQVVRSILNQGAAPLVVPDKQQMPALIENVWGARRMGSLVRVPTATEDFHGDGGHGEVDVVLSDRQLRDALNAPSGEPFTELAFGGRLSGHHLFAGGGRSGHGVHRSLASQGGGVGGPRHRISLVWGLSGHPDQVRVGPAADLDSMVNQLLSQGGSGHAVLVGQGQHADAGHVIGGDVVDVGQDGLRSGWNAAGHPDGIQSLVRDARIGRDLLHRLAGQVELDRVVQVDRSNWSGHVYNLETDEGWYAANGLIVSNCRCYHIPGSTTYNDPVNGGPGEANVADAESPWHNRAAQSPEQIFNSLSHAEQDAVFGRGNAQAIRDGADLIRVVNATRNRSNLRTTITGPLGERYKGTIQGMPRGQSRLIPEAIYKIAGDDRAYAQQLLRKNGYIR